MKLFVLFSSDLYRCPSQKNFMSFRNLARHLFVYSQREKYAATLTMKCLPNSLLKCMNYSALMKLTRLSDTLKWDKKAAELLEKLNHDCNMTAGLEAKLSLAVGTTVMLRRNVDTDRASQWCHRYCSFNLSKPCHGSVDHMSEPYDVGKVRSRFMVMKNYVYRKQFRLLTTS